jgi:hypothetical protein
MYRHSRHSKVNQVYHKSNVLATRNRQDKGKRIFTWTQVILNYAPGLEGVEGGIAGPPDGAGAPLGSAYG